MAKHTPGPWKVSRLRDEHHVITTEDDHTVIADAYGRDKEPNGRLIAAAPELLEAAKSALLAAEDALSNYLGGDSLVRALADLEPVRAAISKSEGRS